MQAGALRAGAVPGAGQELRPEAALAPLLCSLARGQLPAAVNPRTGLGLDGKLEAPRCGMSLTVCLAKSVILLLRARSVPAQNTIYLKPNQPAPQTDADFWAALNPIAPLNRSLRSRNPSRDHNHSL